MRRVIIESPLNAPSDEGVRANQRYARLCLLDCLRRGEAPLATHLLYTQVLNDRVPADRALGIEAGLAWGILADATVVYVDRGTSNGMIQGIERAEREGRSIEYRRLGEYEAELAQTLRELTIENCKPAGVAR